MTNSETNDVNSTAVRRSYCRQERKWQRFRTTLIVPTAGCKQAAGVIDDAKHPYLRQYSHVYHQRLAMLGPKCWDVIESDSNVSLVKVSSKNIENDSDASRNAVLRVDRILELRENTRSVAVGTLVKESVCTLDSTSTKTDPSALHPNSLCRESDQLFLEDESGRVGIEFTDPKKKHEFCSGIVLGMLGMVGIDGVMTIEKVYLPVTVSNRSSDTLNLSSMQAGHDPHLLLLSGTHFGSAAAPSIPSEMLLSFLQGSLGAISKAAQVSQIIFAGGLVASPLCHGSCLDYDITSSTVYGCNELDGFCYQVAQQTGIPITLLPGQDDPTTANWPQRPLHRSLLPISLRSSYGYGKLISAVPNPFAAVYDCPESEDTRKQYVVGTDGYNIKDLVKLLLLHKVSKTELCTTTIMEQSTMEGDDGKMHERDQETVEYKTLSELTALEMTLRWGHICPTGPHSVPTVPHGPDNPDPMVLLREDENELPSIYFCGNCTKFATKLVHAVTGNSTTTTRLICIPRFIETGEAVLVNLASLEVELLRFEE